MPTSSMQPSASRNRPQQERLLRIFKMLSDGKFPNCTDFARELEVTTRTVMRDLDFLRDRMHLPIAFDQQKNGYWLTKPITHLPLIEVSEKDLTLIFICERVAAQYGHLVLGRRLHNIFSRLAGILGSTVQTTWAELNEILTVHHSGASMADISNFDLLRQALMEKTKLKFSYKGFSDVQYRTRHVHPYHLGLVNGQWYLFGWDESRKEMRTFSLARMRSIKSTGLIFEIKPEIDVRQFLSSSFGVIYKACSKVRLRVEDDVALLLRERVWHPSQKFNRSKDGGWEMTMNIADTQELRNWIMGWGPSIEVLEPVTLRDEIATLAKKAAEIYTRPEV
jgi:predicted DNA-binding transcriptional regulator YafY